MVWDDMSASDVGKISCLKRSINGAVTQDVLDHFLILYNEGKFGENMKVIREKTNIPFHWVGVVYIYIYIYNEWIFITPLG